MADTFTPEQISQILEEFFDVVGTRQYIGARYVPIFGRKGEQSIQWDNSKPYEPLTVVLYQGNSYTSRQYVPTGVVITNEDFWALTGNYNAQIEQYRIEVEGFADDIADATQIANDALADTTLLKAIIPSTEFTAQNTVKDAIDSIDSAVDNISSILPESSFDSTNTVAAAIDALNDALPLADFDSTNTVSAAIDAINDALPIGSFDSTNTVESAIDSLNAETDALAIDSIMNAKYVGRNATPIVDGTWYSYYNDEYFYPSGLCTVNGNVYIGAHNEGDARSIVTLANKAANNFAWTREFSNSNLGHLNSMAWDSLRNRFMLSANTGYGIRVADSAFGNVTIDNQLWPFTTWAGRIAFDRVTNWGYVIDDGNMEGVTTRHLYCLEPDANAFELMCDINMPTYDLQDICAYNDTLFIASTTNGWSIYHINRTDKTCTLIESGTFNSVDANELYYFGEFEGCDFDLNGALYCSFISGPMCVVTRVPYQGNYIMPINRSSFQSINLVLNAASRAKYRNALNELKSITELTVRANKSARTLTYGDTIVEHAANTYLKDIEIIIPSGASVTFNQDLTCVGGHVTLVNMGTMISNARELLNVYNAAGWVTINCDDSSVNTFNSAEHRVAYTNAPYGGFVYVHHVPDGFAGTVNSVAATNKTLFGCGAKLITFS